MLVSCHSSRVLLSFFFPFFSTFLARRVSPVMRFVEELETTPNRLTRREPAFESILIVSSLARPDGVQRVFVAEIIKRFEQKGFKLVALKMIQPTK